MTISATTGVPSSPRSRSVFSARIDWSKRMLWLTPSFVPVSSQTLTISTASARVNATGFWARMPLTCGRLAASRTISSCWSGG